MNFRRRLLNRMKEGDRVALSLIRGEAPMGTAEMHAAFAAMHERLTAAGLHILKPGAIILGEDEGHVLGWLALLQRQRLEPALTPRRVAMEEAWQCAKHLDSLGVRLDYRHAVQGADGNDVSSRLAAAGFPVQSRDQPGLAEGSRQKVIKALSERSAMRTIELTALGVSRQLLACMVKSGQIRRVKYGLYALPSKFADDL